MKEIDYEDGSETINKIVTEEELYEIKFKIRAQLITNKVNKEIFIESLFMKYKDKEKISIRKLMNRLRKNPLKLNYTEKKLLARYIIEPRDDPKLEYNNKRKKSIKGIKEILEEFLEIAYTFTPESLEIAIKETLHKINFKLDQIDRDIDREYISLTKWQKIFQERIPDLNQMQADIVMSIGFESTNDTDRLSLNVI